MSIYFLVWSMSFWDILLLTCLQTWARVRYGLASPLWMCQIFIFFLFSSLLSCTSRHVWVASENFKWYFTSILFHAAHSSLNSSSPKSISLKLSSKIFWHDGYLLFQLLKLEKKIPGLVLLGGIVEERFMSVQDLKHYASLPSLHTLQGQLVSILSTPAQHLSQNLSANQVCFS